MNLHLQLYMDLFGLILLFAFFFLSDRSSQILLSSPEKDRAGGGRSESIDFIRGLAITGIVFIHVNSYFQYFGPEQSASIVTLAFSNIARFSVPAFILSSGIFLKYTNFRDYWKSKILSLILPYFFASLLAAYVKLGTFPEIVPFLTGLLLGTWCTPYYFVPLLFSFYLIFPLLSKIQAKFNTNKAIFSILLLSLIVNLFSNHIFFLFPGGILRTIEPILFTGFVFFFTFGMLAGKWFRQPESFLTLSEEKSTALPHSLKTILWIGISIYLAGMVLAGFIWKFDSSNHLLYYPFGMFLLLFFWSQKAQDQKRHKTFIRCFAFIGKNSMGIFLLHPILIHLMHAINPFHWGIAVSWLLIPITGLINVLLPLLVWLALNRTLESLTKSILPKSKT
ncbi:acyltransferase [Leptospira stimsonii]|uniref:Acyltransferase n=2 Tax=Leptospira stimsonii TaxID=2202203 RepID=A0ABY2N267_9LEPT|nr:acyltransferase [Leptospira stimsonii]TGK20619.1 acyltransferase [Leptospira stimsonii]TGM14408.1 acyltransferase [Leptospira stimsonii]